MNRFFPTILSLCASLAVVGCNRNTDANGELERAARALEKAEPAQMSQPAPADPASPGVNAPATAPAAPPPAQQMKAAMASYKAGELEEAVTRLQRLRATPIMPPEQRMALQDAVAAVMTEIHALAAKGDPRAQQALKRYEQMQNSR